MGSCVQFPSQHWNFHMAQIHAGSMYIATVSVSMHVSPAMFKKPAFLGLLHILWFLKSSCLLFFRVPELSGERFGRNIPLRTECSKGAHASNIIQVWTPFLSKRKLLCWWLNEILMYESKRRPLGSILLVHYQNNNMWLFLRYRWLLYT